MIKKILLSFALSFFSVTILLANNSITVFYFYSDARCSTCYKLEKYTSESLKENFKTELSSGKIIFKPINISEPNNKHYLTDYQLYTKSVILDNGNGEWENLDQIWQLVRNEKKFKSYIAAETKKFMEKK
ncbi:MAG: nitrophenyl compound nitroreductase subunit ArsF family protein [Endomicrobiaceae bacterium]|nr:nitrophenyl compound nitroreductase subunit ArsF family protein [Endomicrobiaceae bacterium]